MNEADSGKITNDATPYPGLERAAAPHYSRIQMLELQRNNLIRRCEWLELNGEAMADVLEDWLPSEAAEDGIRGLMFTGGGRVPIYTERSTLLAARAALAAWQDGTGIANYYNIAPEETTK